MPMPEQDGRPWGGRKRDWNKSPLDRAWGSELSGPQVMSVILINPHDQSISFLEAGARPFGSAYSPSTLFPPLNKQEFIKPEFVSPQSGVLSAEAQPSYRKIGIQDVAKFVAGLPNAAQTAFQESITRAANFAKWEREEDGEFLRQMASDIKKALPDVKAKAKQKAVDVVNFLLDERGGMIEVGQMAQDLEGAAKMASDALKYVRKHPRQTAVRLGVPVAEALVLAFCAPVSKPEVPPIPISQPVPTPEVGPTPDVQRFAVAYTNKGVVVPVTPELEQTYNAYAAKTERQFIEQALKNFPRTYKTLATQILIVDETNPQNILGSRMIVADFDVSKIGNTSDPDVIEQLKNFYVDMGKGITLIQLPDPTTPLVIWDPAKPGEFRKVPRPAETMTLGAITYDTVNNRIWYEYFDSKANRVRKYVDLNASTLQIAELQPTPSPTATVEATKTPTATATSEISPLNLNVAKNIDVNTIPAEIFGKTNVSNLVGDYIYSNSGVVGKDTILEKLSGYPGFEGAVVHVNVRSPSPIDTNQRPYIAAESNQSVNGPWAAEVSHLVLKAPNKLVHTGWYKDPILQLISVGWHPDNNHKVFYMVGGVRLLTDDGKDYFVSLYTTKLSDGSNVHSTKKTPFKIGEKQKIRTELFYKDGKPYFRAFRIDPSTNSRELLDEMPLDESYGSIQGDITWLGAYPGRDVTGFEGISGELKIFR